MSSFKRKMQRQIQKNNGTLLHRIGAVGAVNVISMVAKGTIDEAVEDYLLENKDLIDRVVDGKGSKQDIKTILNKLLSI